MLMSGFAFAAGEYEETQTFTISVNENSHTDFKAVQIFKGTQVVDGNDDNPLGDIVWGDNITDELKVSIIGAINNAMSLHLANDASALTVAEAISDKNLSYNDAQAKDLAQALGKILANVDGTALTSGGKNEVVAGYYLVIDTKAKLGDNDAYNASLLQMTKDITITKKTDAPSVEKKIDGNNDSDTTTSGLVDANNGQVGDLVPYVITSTVPDTTYYDKYYMEFNDTVSDGLDISATDAADKYSAYKVEISCAADDAEDADKDGYKDATGYNLTVTGRNIKVAFADVKGLDGKTIKITYKAKINENAKVGVEGNPNTVTLKYTNSPDHSGDGEYNNDNYTSTTPEDVVVTYLTSIELLKVDKNDREKILPGAVFEITGSRTVSTIVTTKGFAEATDGTYYKLKTTPVSYTETAPGGAIADDKYDSKTTKYKATETTETKTETTDVKVQGTTDASGYLKFNELGAGNYTIREITAPTGYNLITDPIEFTIGFTAPTSVIDGTEECSWSKSGTDANDVTYANGVFSITVENAQGATLPSTGGIGTTIFYVAGSILVLAAAILLITKRRMGVND